MIKPRLPKFSSRKCNYGLKTFLYALVTAAIIFLPFIIMGGGIFYYYGDFNVQEIPFYQLAHNSVRTGQVGWHNLTDLGTDFLSSYSFYLLGSPFFWLTIPFPNSAVPYLIGPLLILKFACAALSAYLFLRRYVQNKNFAVVGGLVYAFSGFSLYNVFFFHFHEPMIIFPLLLAALDAFIYDKKRMVFATTVFASCVINYYFFVGQVLFVIIYYLVITLSKTYKFNIKEFLLLAVEVLIGFFATAFILLPSILGLLGNPRLDSYPQGWDALVHSNPQRYWLTIISFFFPSDTPAFPIFTPDSNCKWASVAGWLPLFGMTGVIAYFQTQGKSWLKKIILILILFAFVPALNSMFQMFNISIYYARWYYMLVLLFTLATLKSLENAEVDWNRAVLWSTGITVGISLLIGLMPNITESEEGEELFNLGVQADFERFWFYVLLSLMSILAFVLILKKYKENSRKFSSFAILGVFLVSLGTSAFVIAQGYAASNTRDTIDGDIINKADGIKVDDIYEVRSDFYECVDNVSMFWNIQSINCFQSSVSSSIMQFYEAMGISRDVASRPDTNSYGLRSFLSCKYLFDYRPDGKTGSKESFVNKDGKTKMPNWKYLKTCNRFDIYENECYIPMGYTYTRFVTEEEFDRIENMHRTEAILYAMTLSREQMEKYADITGYKKEKYDVLYGKKPDHFDSFVDRYKYGSEPYEKACSTLKMNSCSSFEYTDTGFVAEYNNKGKKNLLFFSVPYSDGFSATVNGVAVDVEKANFGFMAIEIPADTRCKIEFTYETPGFSTGCQISLIAFGLFIAYFLALTAFRVRKKRKVK